MATVPRQVTFWKWVPSVPLYRQMPEMPSTVKLPVELKPDVSSTASVVFRLVSVWAPLTCATPQSGVGSFVLSVVEQRPLIDVPPPLS